MIGAQADLRFLTESAGDVVANVADVAFRIALAAVLGAGVALLYRASRSPDARHRGFGHTLVMLAPLIAMVTAAVGDNVAAAFTLVGTLAIVRFRATVSDTRDMAFVIFSVAVGMALGGLNLVVALAGFVVIGLVVLFLRRLELRLPGRDGALLRLAISPPDPDPGLYAPVLMRYVEAQAVVRCSIDRRASELELRLAVHGLDPDKSPALLAELLQIPEVVRASFTQDDVE